MAKKKDKVHKVMGEFKRGLRPFYLGRSQAQVKEPLPRLQTTYHAVDLDAKQTRLLLEDIPNGTFALPPTLVNVAGEIPIDGSAEDSRTLRAA